MFDSFAKTNFYQTAYYDISATKIIDGIIYSSSDIDYLKTIVIVIDDLGEHQNRRGGLSELEDNIVGFVNEFVETQKGNDLSIVIILLTYPGFLLRTPWEKSFIRRKAIKLSTLEPFTLADTEALTEYALRSAGCTDANIIKNWSEWLHAASGGIPDIIQELGFEAYENELGNDCLTSDAVLNAIKKPKDELIGKLYMQLQVRGWQNELLNNVDVPLMRCLAEIEMQHINPISMTKKLWINHLKENTSGSNESIYNFMNRLIENNVMICNDNDHNEDALFAFFAEAIRINLLRIMNYKYKSDS